MSALSSSFTFILDLALLTLFYMFIVSFTFSVMTSCIPELATPSPSQRSNDLHHELTACRIYIALSYYTIYKNKID